MSSVNDTIYTILSQSPSPLSIRTIARKTKIGKKFVRVAMKEYEREEIIVRVHPYKIGSGKARSSVFCTKDNTHYA